MNGSEAGRKRWGSNILTKLGHEYRAFRRWFTFLASSTAVMPALIGISLGKNPSGGEAGPRRRRVVHALPLPRRTLQAAGRNDVRRRAEDARQCPSQIVGVALMVVGTAVSFIAYLASLNVTITGAAFYLR